MISQIYQEGIVRSKLCIVQNAISATIVLLALLNTNISITFLIITCTAIIYFLPRLFNNRISLAQEKVSKQLAHITRDCIDYLEGLYVISTYNYQKKAGEKFDFTNKKYYEKKNSLIKISPKVRLSHQLCPLQQNCWYYLFQLNLCL